jgi:hypothetical protein
VIRSKINGGEGCDELRDQTAHGNYIVVEKSGGTLGREYDKEGRRGPSCSRRRAVISEEEETRGRETK